MVSSASIVFSYLSFKSWSVRRSVMATCPCFCISDGLVIRQRPPGAFQRDPRKMDEDKAGKLEAWDSHRKSYSSTDHEPHGPGNRSRPESSDPLLSPHAAHTPEQPTVVASRALYTLQSRLDRVERLSDRNCDQTRHGTQSKRRCCSEPLPRSNVQLRELFQGRVGRKANCRVGGLSSCGGDEAPEKGTRALCA